MVLGGYFEQRRKSLLIFVYSWTNLLCNMLIYEKDGDVLALSVFFKHSLDGRYLCFSIDDKEVLPSMLAHLADSSEKQTSNSVLSISA